MSAPKQRRQVLVELAPGVEIDTEFVSTFPMADGRGTWTVHVRTDRTERKPRLVDHSIHFSEPPSGDELGKDRLRLLLEYAVAERAAAVARRRMMAGHRVAIGADFAGYFPDVVVPAGTPIFDDIELDRVRRRAVDAVRPKRGRRPVTDERKLEILDLYRSKGMKQTIESTGLAESTIRHHLTAARRLEGGQR
jgi:hypothetical protein